MNNNAKIASLFLVKFQINVHRNQENISFNICFHCKTFVHLQEQKMESFCQKVFPVVKGKLENRIVRKILYVKVFLRVCSFTPPSVLKTKYI